MTRHTERTTWIEFGCSIRFVENVRETAKILTAIERSEVGVPDVMERALAMFRAVHKIEVAEEEAPPTEEASCDEQKKLVAPPYDLLTERQIREQYLPVSSNVTIYRYAREGHIPRPLKIGRRYFWRRPDLDAWIKALRPKDESISGT